VELVEDPPTDILDHGCNVGIARRFGCAKAGLETLVGAIEGNALKADDGKMEMQMDSPTEALAKRPRPWLDLLAFATACDRLVHVIWRNRGTEDGMEVHGQVL
jgi:hypothetical protein